MGTASSYGTKGTETGLVMTPGGIAKAWPVVVYCHSRGQLGINSLDSANGAIVRALAEAGYAVVSNDLTGSTNWGNDASQTKVGDAKTYGQGTLGGQAGEIALVCSSAGALTGLNWARANPTLVACVALMVPVVDLVYSHDTEGSFAAEQQTAYGLGAGNFSGNATITSHDPTQNTASHASGPPLKMWRSTNDATATTARQDAFAAATGCAVASLGAVGHSISTVPAAEVVAFVQANL